MKNSPPEAPESCTLEKVAGRMFQCLPTARQLHFARKEFLPELKNELPHEIRRKSPLLVKKKENLPVAVEAHFRTDRGIERKEVGEELSDFFKTNALFGTASAMDALIVAHFVESIIIAIWQNEPALIVVPKKPLPKKRNQKEKEEVLPSPKFYGFNYHFKRCLRTTKKNFTFGKIGSYLALCWTVKTRYTVEYDIAVYRSFSAMQETEHDAEIIKAFGWVTGLLVSPYQKEELAVSEIIPLPEIAREETEPSDEQ